MKIEEMIPAVQKKLGVQVDGRAGPETWGGDICPRRQAKDWRKCWLNFAIELCLVSRSTHSC
jgi:hypothetical protein